jgi:hypothetical protein
LHRIRINKTENDDTEKGSGSADTADDFSGCCIEPRAQYNIHLYHLLLQRFLMPRYYPHSPIPVRHIISAPKSLQTMHVAKAKALAQLSTRNT